MSASITAPCQTWTWRKHAEHKYKRKVAVSSFSFSMCLCLFLNHGDSDSENPIEERVSRFLLRPCFDVAYTALLQALFLPSCLYCLVNCPRQTITECSFTFTSILSRSVICIVYRAYSLQSQLLSFPWRLLLIKYQVSTIMARRSNPVQP